MMSRTSSIPADVPVSFMREVIASDGTRFVNRPCASAVAGHVCPAERHLGQSMDPVSAAYALVMLASADIHLGDLPTWFAAVGTVGALGAALWQIGSERRRRHQREVFDQARRIAAVVGPDKPPEEEGQQGWRGIDLSNGSDEPVYRLLVAMVAIQGDDPHTIEEDPSSIGSIGNRSGQVSTPPHRDDQHPAQRYVPAVDLWPFPRRGVGLALRRRSGLHRPCRSPLDSPCHRAARETPRRPDHPLPRGPAARRAPTRTPPLNCRYTSVASTWPDTATVPAAAH